MTPAMTVPDGSRWATAVASIGATVSLAEFEATGARLRRRDRKYVVDQAVAAQLVDRLRTAQGLRVLEIDGARLFGYDSLYFDTADHQALRTAAAGRPDRFKVRRRQYRETERCLLEVKTRERRGDTVKQRIDAVAFHDDLDRDDGAFVAACLGTVGGSERSQRSCRPRRRAIGARPSCSTTPGSPSTPTSPPPNRRDWQRHSDVVVVETKTAGPPCAADRTLWSLSRRPVVDQQVRRRHVVRRPLAAGQQVEPSASPFVRLAPLESHQSGPHPPPRGAPG